MGSRSVKVWPTLYSIKRVVTAGHDYAGIMYSIVSVFNFYFLLQLPRVPP